MVAVIDGDTIHASIDLGMSVWRDEPRLRLNGLNCDETHDRNPAKRAHGLAAKARVQALLPPGAMFTVRTLKDKTEKYGGYLAAVTLDDGTDLNALLLREGLAVPYDGGAR